MSACDIFDLSSGPVASDLEVIMKKEGDDEDERRVEAVCWRPSAE